MSHPSHTVQHFHTRISFATRSKKIPLLPLLTVVWTWLMIEWPSCDERKPRSRPSWKKTDFFLTRDHLGAIQSNRSIGFLDRFRHANTPNIYQAIPNYESLRCVNWTLVCQTYVQKIEQNIGWGICASKEPRGGTANVDQCLCVICDDIHRVLNQPLALIMCSYLRKIFEHTSTFWSWTEKLYCNAKMGLCK